jgi:hypothetical protein
MTYYGRCHFIGKQSWVFLREISMEDHLQKPQPVRIQILTL